MMNKLMDIVEKAQMAKAGSLTAKQAELDKTEAVGARQQFKRDLLAKNKQALEQLKNGLHKQCLESLKDAESRLVRRLRDEENDKLVLKLLSITLNNIACYYKK